MDRQNVTLFLGAEGWSEVQGEPWIREATDDEEAALFVEIMKTRPNWTERDCRNCSVDATGRPYWLVTIDGTTAPDWVVGQYSRVFRTLRFERR